MQHLFLFGCQKEVAKDWFSSILKLFLSYKLVSLAVSPSFLSARLLQFPIPLLIALPLFAAFRTIILNFELTHFPLAQYRLAHHATIAAFHHWPRATTETMALDSLFETTFWFAWRAPNDKIFKIYLEKLVRLLQRCNRAFFVAIDLKFVVLMMESDGI